MLLFVCFKLHSGFAAIDDDAGNDDILDKLRVEQQCSPDTNEGRRALGVVYALLLHLCEPLACSFICKISSSQSQLL